MCVSTHSRPKAAAFRKWIGDTTYRGFNTQPPEGGCQQKQKVSCILQKFQHTAARRRLPDRRLLSPFLGMFQHTAARRRLRQFNKFTHNSPPSFNTQPPEGGCFLGGVKTSNYILFQHTAARRRLPYQQVCEYHLHYGFNTQPPEGGCFICGFIV